jgi:hypothetical protein
MSDQQSSTPTPTTADDRATTFQAVQGGGEHYSGEVLLVSAYAILWTIVLAWVVFMWRKQRDLTSRLDALEHVLDRADAAQRADPSRSQKTGG